LQSTAPSGETPPGARADGQAEARGRRTATAAAISLAAHGVALIGLASIAGPPDLRPPPVEALPVELLSEAEVAALTPPAAPVEEAPSAVPDIPPPAPPVEPPPLALAHAATILSDDLDGQVRKSLATMALDTRFEQICDVEALEQIARADDALRPERAVAYATAEVKVSGDTMIADGAAFLSGGRWYRLSFRCQTTPDRLKVLSFDFATGGPVTDRRGVLGSGVAED
jgi:hypothetical protein